jgi:sugar-specific transcriptional regulator TrmB
VSQVTPERLSALGLTTYEAKAYLALIRRGSSTAVEVARVAMLPRQRVYDVLASLVKKRLATTRAGNPVTYAAQEPEVAMERLLAERRDEVRQLELEAEAVVEELTPAYREGLSKTDPLEYIEVLRDARAIRERFDEVQSSVEREILVFNKPPYATPLEENVEGLKLVGSHTARAIYEYSLFEEEGAVETVRRFIAAGEEARVVPELPLKLAIVDEATVLFGMEDPVAGGSELTIVVVEHASLAHLLKVAFTAIWDSGMTIDQAAELLGEREPAVAAHAKTAPAQPLPGGTRIR